jgi:cytochrome P450
MSRIPRDPPGPKRGLLGLSHLKRFRENLLQFPTELARTYGDLVCVPMGPMRLYFVNHPTFVREVLINQGKSFRKLPRIVKAFRSIDGNGLVFSEGEFWLRQRRLVQPAFSTKRFDGYARTAVSCTREMVDAWRPGATIEISAAMKRLALHIIARTMFDVEIVDVDVEGRIGAAIETLSAIVTKQTGRVIQWPDWVPFPENRRKLAAVKVLDDIIRRVIRERRGSIEDGGADKGDLLSMLLRAVDEEGDGTGMTDEQARDEAITLFNAGQDTTAAGLTWLWYLLATHPKVEQKLRDEAQSVLGEREAGYADLPALSADMGFDSARRRHGCADG